MKHHFLFSIFILFFISQCDSVTSPNAEPEGDSSAKQIRSLSPPELQEPTNNTKDQNLSPTLTWKKVTGATTYQVQMSGKESFSDNLVNQPTDTTSFQISGLSQDSTYFWRVRALSEDSVKSPWSGMWSFTTAKKTQDSSEPLSTELQSPGNGSQNQALNTELKWTAVASAKGYHVQISSGSNFSDLKSDTVTTATSYEAQGIDYSQTYYWRVQPQLDNTETKWSETRNFSTEAEPAQETVTTTLSSPSKGATGQATSPTLRWERVSEANSYRIQVDTDDSFDSPDTDQTTQEISFTLSGLDNESTYYWRILPETGTGNGEWSEVWNFKTEAALGNNNDGGTAPPSDMWVSAYLASYNHYAPPGGNWGNLPTDEIDWDAFTHLFYFSLKAKVDGSLSPIAPYQNMSPDRINTIVKAAHAHNKPVIITIGGWGNHDGFSNAISPIARPVFISNLVALIETWGFDGIDLDMEPIKNGDVENYKAFVKELRWALDNVSTPLGEKPLLTAATANQPEMFADIQDYFDQINLMTYDFSGAWQGWVSWHNSALYDGALKFPNSSKSLPSIDGTIKRYVAAGVKKSKLGIGIDFYGYLWSGGSGTPTGGVTKPNQSWATAPVVTDNVPYHEIMNKYYQEGTFRWDEQAQAPYLSIDHATDSDDKFVSYDDARAIKEKIDYVRREQLGGTIIWELSGGYRKDQPSGSRDKLLQAIKNSVW